MITKTYNVPKGIDRPKYTGSFECYGFSTIKNNENEYVVKIKGSEKFHKQLEKQEDVKIIN